MQYQAIKHTIPQIHESGTSYQDHPESLGIQPRVPIHPFLRYPIPRYPIPRYPIPRYPIPREFLQERYSSKESFHLSPGVFKYGNNEKNFREITFQIDHRNGNLYPYYGNINNFAFSYPHLANESFFPLNQQFLQENMVLHPIQHFQDKRMISYQPFKVQEGLARLADQSRHIQFPSNNRSFPQSMSYAGGNLFQREHRGEISYFENANIRKSTFSNQHLANGEPLPLIQQENEPIHSTQVYQVDRLISNELPGRFNIQSCPPRLPSPGSSSYIKTSWNEQGKIYKCKNCHKSFKQRIEFQRHIKTHTNQMPYQCDICHKRFKVESKLKLHIRVHTNERPYQCNNCDKSFKLRQHLKEHFRTHTNERPYQCNICYKSFTRSSILANHIRIHERPYQCDICHKRFNERSTLINHIRYHTKERPYQCNICTKRFTRRSSRNIHFRTHTKKGSYQPNLEPAVSR